MKTEQNKAPKGMSKTTEKQLAEAGAASSNPQTPLRLRMQVNGFRWTPNRGKRPLGRSWQERALKRDLHSPADAAYWDNPPKFQDEQTGEWVSRDNPSTGLLIEGDLIAIDVDVDNKDAVKRLFDLACRLFGQEWEDNVLIRQREGSFKETWLFRVDEPTRGDVLLDAPGKFAGPLFYEPGTQLPEGLTKNGIKMPDGWIKAFKKGHRVEFFRAGGGGRGCQIGVLGWHTLPGENDAHPNGIEYEWLDDHSPVAVTREEVPKVSYKAFREFVLAHGDLLENNGWVRAVFAEDGSGGGGVREYTLDTGVTFFTGTSRDNIWEVTYDQLEKGMPIRMAEVLGIDPSVDGSNPPRGFVTERHDGVLGICDSGTGVIHYPPEANPKMIEVRAKRLAERLSQLSAGIEPSPNEKLPMHNEDAVIERAAEMLHELKVRGAIEDEDMAQVMHDYRRATRAFADNEGEEGYQVEARARLLALRYMYAFYPGGKSSERWQCLIPGKSKQLAHGVFGTVSEELAECWVRPDDPARGTEWKPVSLIFADSPLRVQIEGMRYVPWSSFRIARNEDGHLVENTYTAPKLGQWRQEHVDLIDDFLTFMFDDPKERDLYLEWQAYKFLHPDARGAVQVFVADGIEGVGRNTWVEAFLGSAMGRGNMSTVKENKLGTGGQAQYDDWLLDKLMLFVPEIKGMPRAAWEDMKARFEVQKALVTVNVKYGTPRTDFVYASTIIATNHLGALPLDMRTANRRFAIYAQGRKGSLNDEANRELRDRILAVRTGDGGVTPDAAASVVHYFKEVVPQRLGHAPRWELFMNAPKTLTKRKMASASMKPSDEYLEDAFAMYQERGCEFVKPGDVEREAKRLAKVDEAGRDVLSAIRGELKAQTSGGGGFNGWVRVYGRDGGDKLKVGRIPMRVLARSQEAAERFLEMSQDERAEAMTYAPEGSNVSAIHKVAAAVAKRRGAATPGGENADGEEG